MDLPTRAELLLGREASTGCNVAALRAGYKPRARRPGRQHRIASIADAGTSLGGSNRTEPFYTCPILI